jgi:glycosyltransferase involved in cell wall biosynthesis
LIKPVYINYSDFGGGAEQFSREISESFDESCLIVHHKSDGNNRVVTLPNDGYDFVLNPLNKAIQKFSRFSGAHHLLGRHDSFHRTFNKISQLECFRSANLVHLNNIHGGWFDLKAINQIAKCKPIVWTLHDMWALTGGEAYVYDHEGFMAGDWKTPYINNYPLRNPLIDNRKNYLEEKRSIFENLNKAVFVPVSDWLENALRQAYVSKEGMRIVTIKNGVNRQIFKPKKKGDSKGKPKLLYFHNTSPFKGSAFAAEVLKEIQYHVDIVIVGDAISEVQCSQRYQSKIKRRSDLADIYRSVDFILFPSIAENMPLTLLEAMSCGVIPIVFPVGGIPEIVIDGETGFLAEKISSNDLLNAARRAFDSQGSTISSNCIEFIRVHHDLSQTFLKYKALYQELINQ